MDAEVLGNTERELRINARDGKADETTVSQRGGVGLRVVDGGRVGYVADAAVYHYHSESWKQVKRRFEREALALQKIMPQIHVRHRDLVRYIARSIWHDWCHAWREGVLLARGWEIVQYRVCQYTGSFKGNREHRLLSHAEKDKYFYPG